MLNAHQVLDRLNAMHEAGHAVMTVLTGTDLHYVILPLQNIHGDFGGCHRTVTDDQTSILILFAGPGAEVISRRDVTWTDVFQSAGRGDWKAAQAHIDRLPGARRATIAKAKAEVITLLRNNWSWVEAVATALLRERFLTSEQVIELQPHAAGDDQ